MSLINWRLWGSHNSTTTDNYETGLPALLQKVARTIRYVCLKQGWAFWGEVIVFCHDKGFFFLLFMEVTSLLLLKILSGEQRANRGKRKQHKGFQGPAHLRMCSNWLRNELKQLWVPSSENGESPANPDSTLRLNTLGQLYTSFEQQPKEDFLHTDIKKCKSIRNCEMRYFLYNWPTAESSWITLPAIGFGDLFLHGLWLRGHLVFNSLFRMFATVVQPKDGDCSLFYCCCRHFLLKLPMADTTVSELFPQPPWLSPRHTPLSFQGKDEYKESGNTVKPTWVWASPQIQQEHVYLALSDKFLNVL